MVKILKTSLKKCILLIIKFYSHYKYQSYLSFNPEKVKKVLVSAYTGLGNFTLFAPTINLIKEHLKGANFTLLHGNDTGCNEVVSGRDLFLEYIIVRRKENWLKQLKYIYEIRKKNLT